MPPWEWCWTTYSKDPKNILCYVCCLATNRSCIACKSYRLHCTHSSLIVHLLSSKGSSCSLDSRNLGYNNKPHIRPAQSLRLFKDTVGCTFFPLNEAPTLPLRYILETDAVGCDAQLISVDRAFFLWNCHCALAEPSRHGMVTGRRPSLDRIVTVYTWQWQHVTPYTAATEQGTLLWRWYLLVLVWPSPQTFKQRKI